MKRGLKEETNWSLIEEGASQPSAEFPGRAAPPRTCPALTEVAGSSLTSSTWEKSFQRSPKCRSRLLCLAALKACTHLEKILSNDSGVLLYVSYSFELITSLRRLGLLVWEHLKLMTIWKVKQYFEVAQVIHFSLTHRRLERLWDARPHHFRNK